MSDESPLLLAVEALTEPIKSKVVQEKGGITCTSPVELPPLLVQLDNAIRSSMGGSTSGASLAFEGSPLNVGALYEAVKITSQIEQWCRGLKVTPTRQPARDLRAWYAATLARTDDLEVETFRIKQLGTWAHSIESLLDPPRQKDLPDACPVCGATEWWDPKTKAKYPRPLVIRYRPEEEAKATAMCRFCAQTWNARELAFALEEAERHASDLVVVQSA